MSEELLYMPFYDDLGKVVNQFLNERSDVENTAWLPFVDQLLKGKRNTPTQKWQIETRQFLEQLDKDLLIPTLYSWINLAIDVLGIKLKEEGEHVFLFPNESMAFIKRIIWTAGLINDKRLTTAVDMVAGLAYRRRRTFGPMDIKLGNTCLFAFSILPAEKGIPLLLKYQLKIKYGSTQRLIEKYIEKIAEERGMTRTALEDLAVDSCGLDDQGQFIQSFGGISGIHELDAIGKVRSYWMKETDKLQKSVPAKVKREFPEELRQFKAQAKKINNTISVQKARIERSYLRRRLWSYADWKKNFLEHPILSVIIKRLIWTFEKGRLKENGIPLGRHIVNIENQEIDFLDKGTQVRLWHPIHYDATEVLQWRDLLQSLHIQQPFKQAYREVYLITDAERTTKIYSNRFAAHILKQLQFTSLCRVRDWKTSLQGSWRGGAPPGILLPDWNIKAEFWVEADWNGPTNPNGIMEYVFSDQVRFYDNDQQMELEQVPPIVFSEVMRDIDLFVGVTSIGNDPNWHSNGDERFNSYWEDYAFGQLSESAVSRMEALKKLIPRLKIADRCSFSGKFLQVRGDLRTYKIHIGSGNILMLPNDQYLCIVQNVKAGGSNQIFLPFEGDRMLSVILSKAFLLADDNKIKDPTIISQIVG